MEEFPLPQCCKQLELGSSPLIFVDFFNQRMQYEIHKLKYQEFSKVAKNYLLPLEKGCFDDSILWVPVPMYWKKKRERGYNQAEKIALACAKKWGGEVGSLLHKKRSTLSQTKMSQAKRKQNSVDLYSVISCNVPKSKIILVDDVCTTGSTLLACKSVLEAQGVEVSAFFTLAYAELRQDFKLK